MGPINASNAWLDGIWRDALAPEPALLVSEWADRHRVLPPTSALPGAWRTSYVPYLKDIMDALSTGSPYERVVLMKAAQAGGTECGLNWFGYVVHHAPGMGLLVQPSLDMARRNTRVRIDPMIESTPVLRERISEPRSRSSYNSAFVKTFVGGSWVMTGSNSGSALRSTPCRYLFLDEVDSFPADVDGEGDPVAISLARTVTFRGRRRIFLCSTPTITGISRIEKAFLEGTQNRFEWPCKHCGALAYSQWKNVRWPEGRRDLARLVCESCGGESFEPDKHRRLAEGAWHPTAEGDGRTISFHISALDSPFITLAEIVAEHGACRGDPSRMQAWQNLMLGETYEDLASKVIEIGPLAARAEAYDCPDEIQVIVGGADTQDDRIEVEVLGVGVGDETWSLDYRVFVGDPSGPALWAEVDSFLQQYRGGPRSLPIRACCIDSGGHHALRVYDFVRDKGHRRIWAIKGASTPGTPPWPRKPTRVDKKRVPLYIIGTDSLKDAFAARLRLEQPGPGYCHFPVGRGLDYYAGLTSERPLRKYHNGVARRVWTPVGGARNEPLDTRIYAMAALEGLKASGLRLDRQQSSGQSLVTQLAHTRMEERDAFGRRILRTAEPSRSRYG
jgi:phage terminase large subunit GpA-like protein